MGQRKSEVRGLESCSQILEKKKMDQIQSGLQIFTLLQKNQSKTIISVNDKRLKKCPLLKDLMEFMIMQLTRKFGSCMIYSISI